MSQPPQTTTRLLTGLFDPRDRQAWEQFDGRYRPLIVAYAKRRGLQDSDAEDVAQETVADFVKAYREGQYDRSRGRLRDWLRGFAVRRIARFLAQRGRQIGAIGGEGAPEIVSSAPDRDAPDQVWKEEWERRVLAVCKEHIGKEFGEEYRYVFEEYILKGRPSGAVAKELHVTRNAVYICKAKIMARVREIGRALEFVD